MARQLHELLKEDQEPFLLNKYISDRRSQLIKRSSSTTSTLKLNKPKPNPINHQNSTFPPEFCKNACFFSFSNTPDLLNSPLFDFTSPSKSPCKSPNAFFLHVPSRTATLLLEAALRIQKQSLPSKSKTQNKTNGFGLFKSLFKTLTPRNQKKEIEGGDRNKKHQQQQQVASANNNQVGFPCSYIKGRPSSAVWSETNEDKSLDMETSTSTSYSDESHEVDHKHVTDYVCCDNDFCESPFRFVLRSNPSSGHQTPELMSPSRPKAEDKEKNGDENVEKLQLRDEDEEKEQLSPVSVLDPPFENDDEGHENNYEDDHFDLDYSYAILQRTKHQLLHKLRSFEKLAGLDPIELEKRMLEEDLDNETSDEESDFDKLVLEVIYQSSTYERQDIQEDDKKLISDLIMEEGRVLNSLEEKEIVLRRVCEKLESWREMEPTTIEMMALQEFCIEDEIWKKSEVHKEEVVGELEVAIFGLLVEEFSKELVC